MKKLLLILGVSLVLGVICANLFNRYVHPDIRFFLSAAALSDRWAEQIRQQAQGSPVYIIAGGSEGRTGVDPAILASEYGIPSINAAMAAGFAMRPNLQMALHYARPGDVLIAKVGLGTGDGTSLEGIRVAVYRMGWRAFDSHLLKPSFSALNAMLTSNSKTVTTYLVKLLLRDGEVYRYDRQTTLHASGWMEIDYTDVRSATCLPKEVSELLQSPTVTGEDKAFARDLDMELRRRGVELWVWYPPEMQHPSYRVHRALEALTLVRMGYRVLRDDTFNVYPDGSLFSDFRFHSSARGAAMNTRKLGELILKPEFWTEKSLLEWLAEHGVDRNSTPAAGTVTAPEAQK